MIQKGFFVLEGIDGAGTTTQLHKIAALCAQHQVPFAPQAEPTSGPTGVLIRKFLRREETAHPGTLPYLFAADRHEHVYGSGGILSQLDQGKKVLCDRYLFSSLAYQSLDCPWDLILSLNKDFPLPEAVFFLSLDVDTAQKRIDSRGAQKEIFEDKNSQMKVKEAYDRAWATFGPLGLEVIRLDSSQAIDVLTDQIWSRFCR